jgi:hypothetical protein
LEGVNCRGTTFSWMILPISYNWCVSRVSETWNSYQHCTRSGTLIKKP